MIIRILICCLALAACSRPEPTPQSPVVSLPVLMNAANELDTMLVDLITASESPATQPETLQQLISSCRLYTARYNRLASRLTPEQTEEVLRLGLPTRYDMKNCT